MGEGLLWSKKFQFECFYERLFTGVSERGRCVSDGGIKNRKHTNVEHMTVISSH